MNTSGVATCPLRVLVVVGQLGVGGTERHLAQILPRLRAAGMELGVFALKPGGVLTDAFVAGDVPVITHRSRRDGWRGIVQAAWLLIRVLRKQKPQIVHFFLPEAYLVGAPCSLFVSVRRVMSRRSLASYQRKYPGVRRIERLLHGRMDVVLGNSLAVVAELRAEGVPDERLGLIYNGVAPLPDDERSAARAELGIAGDTLMILCVANLIPYKGHRDLLAALTAVHPRLPAGWRLVLVGRDDGIGRELKAQAVLAGIGEHVRFDGAVPDVRAHLAAADIGVLASYEEGFSNAVLEGMVAGLPMVVTDVGGNAEAIVDGVCGRVVPAHTPSALGDALLELARAPDLRVSWGTCARERALHCFSIETCVAVYEALYRNLAAGAEKPVPPMMSPHRRN